jgi:hypothetical protein
MTTALDPVEVWRRCAADMSQTDNVGHCARSLGADSTWSELLLQPGRTPVLVERFGVADARTEGWDRYEVGIVSQRTLLTARLRSSPLAVIELVAEVAARRQAMATATGIVRTTLSLMAGSNKYFDDPALPADYSQWATIGAWAAAQEWQTLDYEKVDRHLSGYLKALSRNEALMRDSIGLTLPREVEVTVVASTLYAFMVLLGLP